MRSNRSKARIAESGPNPPGQIRSSIVEAGPQVAIAVEDNGKGLPQQGRERLTEPYVTTRAKGTGLGLAIVKKIMEDHQGELILEDRESRRGSGGTGVCRRGTGRIAVRSQADGASGVEYGRPWRMTS